MFMASMKVCMGGAIWKNEAADDPTEGSLGVGGGEGGGGYGQSPSLADTALFWSVLLIAWVWWLAGSLCITYSVRILLHDLLFLEWVPPYMAALRS